MWYVFLAVTVIVIVIAVFVWYYRKKTAEREARSRRRFEQLFQAGAPGALPAAPAPAAAPMPAATARSANVPPAAKLVATERLLSQAETLIYYLLKTAIPDHEVFPKVMLTAVVDVAGKARDREPRVAAEQIDFVVCDKSMRIVAAVQIAGAGGAEAAVAQRMKTDSLKAAGIRLVTINPAALPQRGELRSLVCSPLAGRA